MISLHRFPETLGTHLYEFNLPKKGQDRLLSGVRLSEHRGAGLQQDIVLREFGAFCGNIEILDSAIGGFDINFFDTDVLDVELEL